MISSGTNACIAQTSMYVDETIIKPDQILRWLIVLGALRAKKFSVAIDLNHAVAPHTIFAIRLIKPLHVASPFKDGRWGVKGVDLKLFDLMPPQNELKYMRPIAETYLDIARLLECPTEDCIPYPLPNHLRSKRFPNHYIILNQSGSRPSMKITDADMGAIIRLINVLDFSIQIVIPSMQDSYGRLLYQFKNFPMVNILPPSTSIEPLLALIQFSKLVVTPDTALVHIACAYSVPLVAVYTNDQALYAQWQPYPQTKASVIQSNEPKGVDGYSLAKLLNSIQDRLLET